MRDDIKPATSSGQPTNNPDPTLQQNTPDTVPINDVIQNPPPPDSAENIEPQKNEAEPESNKELDQKKQPKAQKKATQHIIPIILAIIILLGLGAVAILSAMGK